MAHENLKFKIDTKSDQWQPIFGNQELGTFFMIYMKIKEKLIIEKKGVKSYKYTLKFKIQNFRGDITIGFGDDLSMKATEVENDFIIRASLVPFSEKFKYRYNYRTSKEISKGHIIDSLATVVSIPERVKKSNYGDMGYLDPRLYLRNGEDLDAVVTLPEENRKKLLREINTYNEKYLREQLKGLLSRKAAAGSTGICCPRISVVI